MTDAQHCTLMSISTKLAIIVVIFHKLTSITNTIPTTLQSFFFHFQTNMRSALSTEPCHALGVYPMGMHSCHKTSNFDSRLYNWPQRIRAKNVRNWNADASTDRACVTAMPATQPSRDEPLRQKYLFSMCVREILKQPFGQILCNYRN